MSISIGDLAAKGLTAFIADLDGVVTDTADVHARAWKRLFDAFLEGREGPGCRPFDAEGDYREYVDGKPRYDGVRAFLESRGITLPEGTPDDPPDAETVCGLGNRKNERFRETVERDGVTVYDGAVALLEALRARGFAVGLVSSSKNTQLVVEAAGLARLFDTVVDGVDRERLGLPGKPAPDTFTLAAERLGVAPAAAVVAEDAVVGVEAGRAGGFGLVLGVDRGSGPDALKAHGADVVVNDLGEVDRDG